ncbi:CinA family protein [Catenuloplanes atrovinosus]|uniref:Nicotinamide-nucleotide amidase n=1 Tax=Catenuloplanes atrovinosus TaxID=137266 RepID=A0AAE3YJN0_9ACTN|nr:CinA family protein [Catenuloplanes atrovinosus]MDR7273423.1 nicotinamide-nucleotide amidase [Catenuloplanes atrovinosus]
MSEGASVAATVVAALAKAGQTVAAAESLTGGLVSSTLVDVPGASAAFRGGVVVYATELKATLAGVSAPLLAERGPVDPDVAAALAEGVRARCDADWGLATTGVAGPEPQDGKPVGLVYVAVSGPGGTEVRRLDLGGDRVLIRVSTVTEVLRLLADRLRVSVLPGATA